MDISRIQNNNQPNFGIRYRNLKAWNKELFNTFETSELVKEIDRKYPKAKVNLIKFTGEESIANSEIIHPLVMDIQLAKDKFIHRNNESKNFNIKEINFLFLHTQLVKHIKFYEQSNYHMMKCHIKI